MPKATLRKKPTLTSEEREKFHAILRKAAAPPGMLPADTLRARQLPDGTWELKPLHELGRVSIHVDPAKRECSGYDLLFDRSKKQEKLTAEAYPRWFLPQIASYGKVIKAVEGHGGRGVTAFATFSLPPRLMDPFVKREAIRLLPPIVWRVHARLNQQLKNETLQLVWKHAEEFAEIDAKAPSLLALALWLVSQHLLNYLDTTKPVVTIERLHTGFRSVGGTPAAWRYLLRSKIHVAKYVLQSSATLVEFATAFNFLAQVGEPVRPGYTAELARDLKRRVERYRYNEGGRRPLGPLRSMIDVPRAIPFVRAFVRATKRNIKAARRDLSQAADYFASEFATIERMDSNQLAVPWKVWKARSTAWHATFYQRQTEVEAEDTRAWASLLPEFNATSYSATALVSAKELAEEGAAMHHCVASYASMCVRGDCQIYSIKKAGKRVATLELRIAARMHTDPSLGSAASLVEIGQLHGPCNADVDRFIKVFAEKLTFAYANVIKVIPTEKVEQLSVV